MLRSACPLDVERLLELENLLFDNAMSERMLMHELIRGRGWVWGDPIEGYILIRMDGPLIDITRLGVAPESQGKGIGRALLDKSLEDARDAMLTVLKTNTRALQMYRHAGFTIVGHLVGAHSWVMRRTTY